MDLLRNSAFKTHQDPHAKLMDYRKELPENFVCETTYDMQYLRQYFLIREYAYRVDLGLQNFSGEEDELDLESQFIIARKGHFVVAGARLTIVPIGVDRSLPVESESFKVKEIFPALAHYNYCELGRTAVLPQYRNGLLLDEVFRVAAEAAVESGCKFLVGASPPSVARRFRNSYNSMGYPTTIHEDIRPPLKPIHEHLRLKFLVTNLCPQENNELTPAKLLQPAA